MSTNMKKTNKFIRLLSFLGQNGSGYRVIYRLVVMVWIFCGLAWLAMVLNIAGDYMKSFTTKVGDKDGDKENEDAEEAKVGFLSLLSYVCMNLSSRFWTRTDTNGYAQSQKNP